MNDATEGGGFRDSARFDHAHVFCSDLSASERWFSDVLGADVERRPTSTGQPATAVATLHGVTILLRPAREGEALHQATARCFGLDHLGFLVTNVQQAVEELRALGAHVETEPKELRPGVWVAFIQGPDNLRIELLEK